MGSFDDIWALVLERIKKDFSENSVNLWFSDLELTGLTEQTASFCCKSDFKRSFILKNFSDRLSDYFKDVAGFRPGIEIKLKKNDDFGTGSAVNADSRVKDSGGGSIISNYTFENFIVGNSNKFAHAACLAVANHPGKENNPLFIYGPSGLGKTHLLFAMINRISKVRPDLKIIYVKGEEFINQLVESLGPTKKNMESFRKKYRNPDILLIDDIQFIAGKESTQEEIFNTFNALYENNRQIILTSDRPPKDMAKLEERLRTRFESGLQADIQPPDLELRMAILKSKADMFGIELPGDVIDYIALNLKNNVRQLEGALKKIKAQSLLCGEPITLNLAISCISDMITASEPASVTADRIISAVSKKYGISSDDIKSKKQTRDVSAARQTCVYLIKSLTDMSYQAIGKIFNRDYATMISSYKQIENKTEESKLFEMEIKELIGEIRDN